jgi:hypothetical protein
MEKIVDQRIGKKTKRKTYFEYLVKWKGHPIEDSIGKMKLLYRIMENAGYM